MTRAQTDRLIRLVCDRAISDTGHCYLYGGTPGIAAQACWDCSSACNYWWGYIGGQAIPGYARGTYRGEQHGPSTLGWLGAQGGVVGSIPRAHASAGDLAVWTTHMGLCISNTEMMSAQTPQAGTQRSGIDGFIQGEPLIILRLAVIGPGGITLPPITIPGGAALDAYIKKMAQEEKRLIWKRMAVRRTGVRMP